MAQRVARPSPFCLACVRGNTSEAFATHDSFHREAGTREKALSTEIPGSWSDHPFLASGKQLEPSDGCRWQWHPSPTSGLCLFRIESNSFFAWFQADRRPFETACFGYAWSPKDCDCEERDERHARLEGRGTQQRGDLLYREDSGARMRQRFNLDRLPRIFRHPPTLRLRSPCPKPDHASHITCACVLGYIEAFRPILGILCSD